MPRMAPSCPECWRKGDRARRPGENMPRIQEMARLGYRDGSKWVGIGHYCPVCGFTRFDYSQAGKVFLDALRAQNDSAQKKIEEISTTTQESGSVKAENPKKTIQIKIRSDKEHIKIQTGACRLCGRDCIGDLCEECSKEYQRQASGKKRTSEPKAAKKEKKKEKSCIMLCGHEAGPSWPCYGTEGAQKKWEEEHAKDPLDQCPLRKGECAWQVE